MQCLDDIKQQFNENESIISASGYTISDCIKKRSAPGIPNSQFGRTQSQRLNIRCQSLDLFPPKIAQSIAISMVSAHLNPEQVSQAIILLQTKVCLNEFNQRRLKIIGNNHSIKNNQKIVESKNNVVLEQVIPENLIETLINNIPKLEMILKLSDRPVNLEVCLF